LLLGLYSTGLQLSTSGQDAFNAGLEHYEMAQLARQLELYGFEHYRLPTKEEFPDFCRLTMRNFQRDPSTDRWGMPYWYENQEYEGRLLNNPIDLREFVLISAGPDKVWLSQDDVVIARIATPEALLNDPERMRMLRQWAGEK
jgi:hypothetical protein